MVLGSWLQSLLSVLSLDGGSLPVVTSLTTTTTFDLDLPALALHDLEKNLFENANNSCPTSLDSLKGIPGWIELGTCCWGTPEIFVVETI